MTRRDEVIRMAREAGFVAYGEDMGEYRIPVPAMHSRLERFADAWAARERERCLSCYSPDDTATDWADKIRALAEDVT